MSKLLGPDGNPIAVTTNSPAAIQKQFAGYVSALYQLDSPSIIRAQRPLTNHGWLYAAAMIRAVNLSQAPLYLYRETEATLSRRRDVSLKRYGRWHGPKAGAGRMAVHRHLSKASNPARYRGARLKALEIDLDHPLSHLLLKPNDILSQAALIQITSLWLSLRGECIWMLIRKDGRPLSIGEYPEEIWPLSPDLFTPRFSQNRLIGWWFKAGTCKVPRGLSSAGMEPIGLHEIIQFKYPNPDDPYRGLTPLTAAASNIDHDLMVSQHNRNILANGADPGGILTYDGELNPDEEEEGIRKWESRHKGPGRRNRLAILRGAWKYTPTGLSPQDMQHLESQRWNRETLFGVLRVPKSTAGVTDDLNYATQLGQDKNLWDKSLLPDVALIETTLDSTLLFEETDDVVVAFDLSGIEALREGMSSQIDSALKLMDQKAHMPPRTAFELVGLTEIPEYEGDDVSLIPGLVTPVSDILNPEEPPPPPPPEETPEDDSDPAEEEEDEETPPVEEAVAFVNICLGRSRRNKAARSWKNFIKVQGQVENAMRRNWRSWIKIERDLQLAEFDKATKALDIDAILVPLPDLQSRIGAKFRPSYAGALESTYALVDSEVGGVPTFELDDPKITAVFDRRMKILTEGPPKTLQNALRSSLAEGVRTGESIMQLRERVSEVFKISASSPKTLQIARTESAGFMNNAREEMFVLSGFKELEWVTAGDENVRESHKYFGSLGPQPVGTNYLSLPGYPGSASGTLEFPGDTRAGAGEIVNCRCVKVVV